MSEQNNEAVVRRFVGEVINDGDYAVLPELVSSDYVYRSPGQELRGHKALEALFNAYRSGLPDLKVTIDDLIESANKVVISITLTGAHTGDLMGIPATGRQLAVQGMVLTRFEDGRIAEEWEILDMLGLFQQLGVVSFPP